MNYILFDESIVRTNLLPLTFMRPVADIRVGILTIREKWEKRLKTKTSTLTDGYLSHKFPIIRENENILINGSICPNDEIITAIKNLKRNQIVLFDDVIIALHVMEEELDRVGDPTADGIEEIRIAEPPLKINHTWEIFSKNETAIQEDFELLTRGRKSQKISISNRVFGEENIFVEKGAKLECAVLNATTGPIYIGKDSEIMEGALIRGPFVLCEGAQVKMAAKIYGPTTIGPYCRVGGEINNSVLFGYSNKAHDGFLGHSVIAEWCNIGADTNTSNLKNTYDTVRLWSYAKQTFVNTHLQFCGTIMGDHSKCAIDTQFNTGTVTGVSANIFGPGFQRNFVPSFTWGGTAGHTNYNIKKAIEVAEIVFKRRHRIFDETEKDLMTSVYNLTMKNKYL
ncbi:MAG: GlmU family protein [Bacteroidales bacterium]|jgi:UDP-N-acetylglucosamine diphosphorylase/glucosamine-1-phosphate N-acetyltransferase|nr:GlmU family protein [Bacteroidales bacterium]